MGRRASDQPPPFRCLIHRNRVCDVETQPCSQKWSAVGAPAPPAKNITYPAGTFRQLPDGTIIARLAYQQITSEENNKVFRAAAEQRGLPAEQIDKLLAASFVAGPATNVQFMVKDSKKYAESGGWGFAQFTNGKPDGEAVHKTCFACHTPAKDSDFVFTRYSQ